jgi:2'-5' RNA ligase
MRLGKNQNVLMILPPTDLSNEIKRKMLLMNLEYKSKKALRYPPHITIKSFGKTYDDTRRDIGFTEKLISIAEKTEAFSINLKGLRYHGSTESMPGIYAVVENNSHLNNLHKTIFKEMKEFEDRDRSFKENENYSPHMTMVGIDIPGNEWERAKLERKNSDFHYEFPVDEIYLFKERVKSKDSCLVFGLKAR